MTHRAQGFSTYGLWVMSAEKLCSDAGALAVRCEVPEEVASRLAQAVRRANCEWMYDLDSYDFTLNLDAVAGGLHGALYVTTKRRGHVLVTEHYGGNNDRSLLSRNCRGDLWVLR